MNISFFFKQKALFFETKTKTQNQRLFFPIFAQSLTKTLNIMQLLFLGGLHGYEILLIALLILILFGGRKIPELMKGLGKGVKSFKDGMNGAEEPEIKEDKEKKNDE